MIIPNIEALSLTELRYIAIKHGIDGADQMDQEELRESLHEFYEEFGETNESDSALSSPSSQMRFVNSLIDESNEFKIGDLPGVIELPDIYSESTIHLLLKNPFWGHAFWSVCPSDMAKLTENDKTVSFFLRVTMCEKDSNTDLDSFDIGVSKNDVSWNVNLPISGKSYYVSLHYEDSENESGILCTSNHITTGAGYYYRNPHILKDDQKAFDLIFSSLITKGGVLVDSSPIHEIVDILDSKRGTV